MRWIIVTGDSGGLGSHITEELLSKGYGVIGVSRKKTNTDISRYVRFAFDLSDCSSIKHLFLNQIRKVGPIWGLVNNAAQAYDDLVTNADLTTLDRMFNINVISSILMTKYAIREMLLNGDGGSIVNISSVSAHTGYRGLSMYAATKGALEAFSRSVAREWGPRGIRSNCIAPGFMETPMSESLDSSQRERIYRRTCLNRATLEKDVASTVAFLLSPETESITGATFNVDCGTV